MKTRKRNNILRFIKCIQNLFVNLLWITNFQKCTWCIQFIFDVCFPPHDCFTKLLYYLWKNFTNIFRHCFFQIHKDIQGQINIVTHMSFCLPTFPYTAPPGQSSRTVCEHFRFPQNRKPSRANTAATRCTGPHRRYCCWSNADWAASTFSGRWRADGPHSLPPPNPAHPSRSAEKSPPDYRGPWNSL